MTSFSILAQNYGTVEFVENKGQWDPRVRFMAKAAAGGVFLHHNGFTILQHHPDDWAIVTEEMHHHAQAKKIILGDPKNKVRSHAFRVEFLNANENPQVIADKPLFSYNNYFIGNDPSKWATDCKIFQGITIKNIYPGVDVRYYSHNGQMKYDLIVSPGADISRIALRYHGVDRLSVKNRELLIGTSVGELKEMAPYSYQVTDNGRKEITARYVVKGNELRFDLKNYDSKAILVIDPTLVFCSFSGSTADNWGFTATYGPDGSMFGGGIVKESGFPVSTGALQGSYGGGEWDIGIIKLTPDGSNRVFATYIGGKGIEQPHSLIVDPQGNVVIAGRSNSGEYPVTAGTIGIGGSYDVVVTKLNASGTALIGSRKIGGTGDDGVNITTSRNSATSLQQNYGDDGRSEVMLDAVGNIYVATSTQSEKLGDNLPVFGSNRGMQDGLLLKLTPTVSSLVFARYLGGDKNDAAYVLSLHPFNNNIYVGGGTASTNFSSNTSGTLGPANHGTTGEGIIDGYVSIISNDGSTEIKTTYVGTPGIDQVFGVQFDRNGFPYVMGQTTGNWQAINAAWNQPGGKQFIAKLQPDLSGFVYSTMFGSGNALPNISPVAFLVDRCENVYVSGWGGVFGQDAPKYPTAGTKGLPVTPDADKPTTDVNPETLVGQDFYFFVLKKNATEQLYGSFFGQNGGAVDHVDGGTSRFDENGVIYQAICANCKGFGIVPFPTTPGAWSTTNPSPQCNLAMVKIAFNLAGVGSGVQSSIKGEVRDTAGCVPLTVDFTDTLQQGVEFEWNFGDGSPQVTTKTPSISHTYTQIGQYRVMLVAIDSTTCNIRDTSYVTIKVGDNEAKLDFNPVKLDPCDQFIYRFDNLSSASPQHPFNATSFEWDFGDGSPRVTAGMNPVTHSYSAPGTYNVRLILNDLRYCNAPDDTVKVLRVSALVTARFETPETGCAPYVAEFENTSDGGQQFIWNFGDGNTSTEVSPSHTYNVPGTYTVSLIAIDPNTCNVRDTTEFTIRIFDKPVADFSATPQPPTVNTPIAFANLSSPDAVRFKWFFGDGDSLITTTRAAVRHEYNSPGNFEACLIAYNQIGCPDTVCKTVSALVEAAVDVPNAFTPANPGPNSVVYARGYGITRMQFTIWNRWGQKVFESNSKLNGWDGRYKGVMQPMDVYAYTLDVEFFDGTRATKKGDITLIR